MEVDQTRTAQSALARSIGTLRRGLKCRAKAPRLAALAGLAGHTITRPCRGSGGYSPASHRGGQGSTPGQSMWDLWWTK